MLERAKKATNVLLRYIYHPFHDAYVTCRKTGQLFHNQNDVILKIGYNQYNIYSNMRNDWPRRILLFTEYINISTIYVDANKNILCSCCVLTFNIEEVIFFHVLLFLIVRNCKIMQFF